MATSEDISEDGFRVEDSDEEYEEEKEEFEEISEKAYSQLLPEVQKSIDLKQLRTTVRNAKSIAILLTGKTGSGKSTLANGILGVPVAKQGDALQRCTTEVAKYTHVKKRMSL